MSGLNILVGLLLLVLRGRELNLSDSSWVTFTLTLVDHIDKWQCLLLLTSKINCTLPGEGNGNPLQSSCLENPMNRGAWGGGLLQSMGLQRVVRDWNDLAGIHSPKKNFCHPSIVLKVWSLKHYIYLKYWKLSSHGFLSWCMLSLCVIVYYLCTFRKRRED